MAGGARPGPITHDPDDPLHRHYVDHGTLSRHQTPRPGAVGSASGKTQAPPPIVPDGPQREVIVFLRAEFLKCIAYLGYAAPAKDALTDLRKLLNELGIKGTARLASYKGDEYIILSGYPGLRKILTGTKYKASNPKVVDLLVGRTRMIKSAIKGTFLTIILVGVADVISYYLTDEKSRQDLGLTLGVDAMKAIVASAAGFVAATFVAASALVWVPVAVGIGVGVAVSLTFDFAFPTSGIVNAMTEFYNAHKAEGSAWLSAAERDFMDVMNSFQDIPNWIIP